MSWLPDLSSGHYPSTITTSGTIAPGVVVVPNTSPIQSGGTGQYIPPGHFTTSQADLSRLFDSYRSPISSAIPVGEHFMCLKGEFAIRSHGETRSLADILSACKNIRYMVVNSEVIIPKVVWDSLFTYIRGEDSYAGLSPVEFLDKMFAPGENCEAK